VLVLGTSRDELFGQLFGALEKVRYFRNTPDGDDDPAQLEKATRIFHDCVNVGLIFFDGFTSSVGYEFGYKFCVCVSGNGKVWMSDV
jgi:hypothetical protein